MALNQREHKSTLDTPALRYSSSQVLRFQDKIDEGYYLQHIEIIFDVIADILSRERMKHYPVNYHYWM